MAGSTLRALLRLIEEWNLYVSEGTEKQAFTEKQALVFCR